GWEGTWQARSGARAGFPGKATIVRRGRLCENSQFMPISLDQFCAMPSTRDLTKNLSRALYDELRARIADGTYAAGAPLPSTRALAAERGLSRGTVSLVYEQLAADGFIQTRAGAASGVAAGAARAVPARARRGGGHRAATGGHTGRLSGIARRIAG